MLAGALWIEGGIRRVRGKDEPALNQSRSLAKYGIGYVSNLDTAYPVRHTDLLSAGSSLPLILKPSIHKLALNHTPATT